MNKDSKFTFDFFEEIILKNVKLYRSSHINFVLIDVNGKPILKTDNIKSLYKYILKNKYIIEDIEERGWQAYLTVVESKDIMLIEGKFDEVYKNFFMPSIEELLDEGYTLRQIQQLLKGGTRQ